MSLEIVETVLVKGEKCQGNPEGVVRINKSDFVEGEHELFDAPEAKTTKADKTVTPAPAADGVVKQPWAKA
jgi:hypothetical protein